MESLARRYFSRQAGRPWLLGQQPSDSSQRPCLFPAVWHGLPSLHLLRACLGCSCHGASGHGNSWAPELHDQQLWSLPLHLRGLPLRSNKGHAGQAWGL